MKNFILYLLLVLFVLSLACGVRNLWRPASYETATSDLSRDAAPVVDPSDFQTLMDGHLDFAFDLYQQLRAEDGNIVLSPACVWTAMAMSYAGARGNTETEMATALHYDLPQTDLHPAMNQLLLDLASRSDVTLNIANSLWMEQTWSPLTAYLDTIMVNYGAGVNLIDFAGNPEGSRHAINSWVNEETNGLITDAVPANSVTPFTRLILANALYLNAEWIEYFCAEATMPQPFTLLDGTEIMCNTMYQNMPASSGYVAPITAGEIEFKGEDISVVFIMPDQGEFENVEAALDASTFNSLLAALHHHSEIQIYLPKFAVQKSFMLRSPLQGMGMVDAFSPFDADFTGIHDVEPLYLENVSHKINVSVTEKGLEGAASAAVFFYTVGANDLYLSRPFIFVVRDIPTGCILFMGRVLNPNQ